MFILIARSPFDVGPEPPPPPPPVPPPPPETDCWLVIQSRYKYHMSFTVKTANMTMVAGRTTTCRISWQEEHGTSHTKQARMKQQMGWISPHLTSVPKYNVTLPYSDGDVLYFLTITANVNYSSDEKSNVFQWAEGDAQRGIYPVEWPTGLIHIEQLQLGQYDYINEAYTYSLLTVQTAAIAALKFYHPVISEFSNRNNALDFSINILALSSAAWHFVGQDINESD